MVIRVTGKSVRSIIVTSNFPPVRGGSCVVYDRIARHSDGEVIVLAPARDYKTGEPLEGVREHDAASPFRIKRLPVIRPYETPLTQRLPSPTRIVSDLAVMLRVLLTLGWLCVRHRARVVCIGDLIYGGWLIWPARHLFGCRTVVYIHGEELTTASEGRFDRLKTRFLRAADGIIAVSRFAAQASIDVGMVAARKIRIIPNGVDLDLFRPRSVNTALAARHPGTPILLTVARLVERKGVDAMIKALPAVLRRFPDTHYLVVGQGPERDALLDLRDALGLQAHVTLVGSVTDDQLVDYYALADLFVMPNRRMPNGDNEGFGLVFLEANACGKAVVAGDAGGTRDAVTEGETGILVNGDDIDAVAAGVLRLLADDNGRAAMATRGLALAARSSWQLRAADYARFIAELPLPVPEPIDPDRKSVV